MRKETTTLVKRVVLGIAAFACVLAILAWQALRPKILTASKAEIQAVLPPDVLSTHKTDLDGLVRLTRITAIARRLTGSDYSSIAGPRVNLQARGVLARQLWKSDKDSIVEIDKLLSAGPIQCPPESDLAADNGLLSSIKLLSRCLAVFATTSAAAGDFETSRSAVDLDLKLSRKLMDAGGGYLPYLVMVSALSSTESAIQQIARTPSCPISLSRHWLEELPPELDKDPLLGDAIREDFRSWTLPKLTQPTEFVRELIRDGFAFGGYGYRFEPSPDEYEGIGTYDPIATARTMGQIVDLQAANAVRPLSRYDGLPDQIIMNEAAGLPSMVGRKRSVERVQFRLTMNGQQNSIGRSMIMVNAQIGSKAAVMLSCHWRAMNTCTRVLLATNLYRSEHQGSLPESLSELVPSLLPQAPVDPFNDEPMRYDAVKQKVWSVGQDLDDNGGDIEHGSRIQLDIGLSLAPSKSSAGERDPTANFDNPLRGSSMTIRRINSIVR